MGMSSCADDMIIEDKPQTWVQGDTPYYIKIRVATSNSPFTRAENNEEPDGAGISNSGDFEKGTEIENAIGTQGNFAIIFDENSRYISCADLYSINKEDDDKATVTEGVVYTSRFYGYADRKPAKILVVVNATNDLKNKITDFPGWTVSEVMKQISEMSGRYKDANDPDGRLGFGEINITASTENKKVRYFTMTNATYLDSDGKVHCEEAIKEENFAVGSDSEENDLKAAADLKPVTVYIERMVAKTQMTEIKFDHNYYIPTSAQPLDVCIYEPDGKTYNYYKYKWGIQIVGWGMNGLETQNHVFKNIDTTGEWLTHSAFNSVGDKRCYWSHDPHYLDEEGGAVYPWQNDNARDQYDEELQKYYNQFRSYDNKDFNFALRYYPFEKFCSDFDKNAQISGYFSSSYQYTLSNEPVYTPENTFKPGLIVDRSRGSRAYELAGTHAIVAARLLLPDKDSEEIKPYTRGNLYRNRVGVTYDDEFSLLVDFINAVNYKLASNPQMYFKYYDWDDNATSSIKKTNDIKNYRGRTIRAAMEGEYALYCYFPNINSNGGNTGGWSDLFPDLNTSDGVVAELTPAVIQKLLSDQNNNGRYKLYRDADAVNGDGKVIPWICEKQSDDSYKPLKLMVLKKNKNYREDFIHYNEETDTEYMDVNPRNSNYNEVTLKKYFLDSGRLLTFQKFNNGKWEDYEEFKTKDATNQERDDNDIQSLFFEIWGVAECFHYGLMYYVIPIYVQDPGSPLTNYIAVDTEVSLESGINPDFRDDIKLKYYYGLVRDNNYQFTIHSISDIGVPVSDPFKPIVPNYNDKKDQVKFEMEIIGMHTEGQTVTIPS